MITISPISIPELSYDPITAEQLRGHLGRSFKIPRELASKAVSCALDGTNKKPIGSASRICVICFTKRGRHGKLYQQFWLVKETRVMRAIDNGGTVVDPWTLQLNPFYSRLVDRVLKRGQPPKKQSSRRRRKRSSRRRRTGPPPTKRRNRRVVFSSICPVCS